MQNSFKYLLLIAVSFLLIGCSGGSDAGTVLYEKNISISDSESYKVEGIGVGGNIDVNIDIGTKPRSLYVLFTNTNSTESQNIYITHDVKMTKQKYTPKKASKDSYKEKSNRKPAFVRDFYKNLSKTANMQTGNTSQLKRVYRLSKSISYKEGDTRSFYVDVPKTITATLKKRITAGTKFGQKTLNVWLNSNNTSTTQAQIDALAKQFLDAGDDNDIYDWVSNVFGEEWGSEAHSKNTKLIEATNEINILLYDIKNEDMAGFFYQNDNYINKYRSNQLIMFYIDAPMLDEDAGYGGVKGVYSTLAHEFVHMIEFYQKSVMLEVNHEVWIAEMLADTTEDLIATKIDHVGPRGVDPADGSAGETGNTKGRYPHFNQYSLNRALTTWQDNYTPDYSKVNAFGAFLIRKYGGAKLLHDILYSSLEDKGAIVEAVNKTADGSGKSFEDLLREWGVAIMLSDIISPEGQPTYNTGDFTENSYGSSTYQLGSINFFNYDPQPTFTKCSTVQAQGNCYYKIGENLTGDINLNIALGADTEATLIAK